MRGLSRPLVALVAVALCLGLVVIAVRRNNPAHSSVRAPKLDPASSEWQDLGHVPVSSRRDAAIAVTKRYLVVVGGRKTAPDRQLIPLADGAILDLASGEWSATRLPFDVPVAQLAAVSDGESVVVLGTACAKSDLEAGLQSCVPGDLRAARLSTGSLIWKELKPPAQTGSVEALSAIGGVSDHFVFRIGDAIEVLKPQGDWQSTPLPFISGSPDVCLSGTEVVAALAEGTLDQQEKEHPEPPTSENRRTAWAFDVVAQGDATSPLVPVDVSIPLPMSFSAVCTNGGIIEVAQDGTQGTLFDAASRSWRPTKDSPAALSPLPLSVPTPGGTQVIVTEGIDAQRHLRFSSATNEWTEDQVPTFLERTRPETLVSTDHSAVLIVRTQMGQLAVAVRNEAVE